MANLFVLEPGALAGAISFTGVWESKSLLVLTVSSVHEDLDTYVHTHAMNGAVLLRSP